MNTYNQAAEQYTNINIKVAKRNAFLGTPTYGEESGLSAKAVTQLQKIGLQPKTGFKYSDGLVAVIPAPGKRLPTLEAIDAYIMGCLKKPSRELTAMIIRFACLAVEKAKMSYQDSVMSHINMDESIQETLSRIACLCMPPGYLTKVRHPMYFLSTVSRNVGRYIIQLMDTSNAIRGHQSN